MAEQNKKYKITQLQNDGSLLTLHPETDASVVLVNSSDAGTTGTTAQSAIKELKSEIKAIQDGGVVTGVKGSAESTYRKGQVEITKANIGLDKVNNVGITQEEVTQITTNKDDISQIKSNYSLKTQTGNSITMNIDTTTYIMTLNLKDVSGNVLSTQQVDLPLETMVVNAEYDESTKEIVLTLKNGTTTRFSVADLISGLVPDTRTINGKALSSDIDLTKSDIGLGNVLNVESYSKTETDNLLDTRLLVIDSDIDNLTIEELYNTYGDNFSAKSNYLSTYCFITIMPISTNYIVSVTGKHGIYYQAGVSATITFVGFINSVSNTSNTFTDDNITSKLAQKQDTLKNGENIKSINNVSLLGSGNITTTEILEDSGVQAGAYSVVQVNAKGIVTSGGQFIEIGVEGQTAPSDNLAVGGLFFQEI